MDDNLEEWVESMGVAIVGVVSRRWVWLVARKLSRFQSKLCNHNGAREYPAHAA